MTSRASIAWLLAAACAGDAGAQTLADAAKQANTAAAGQGRAEIVLGATKVQRDEAARALLPLLSDVRRRADAPVSVGPGTVPDSPFAGTQTTLFAFSVSKRSVPVDQRVVRAMEQLMAWNPGGTGNEATGHLFDQWLAALQTKNSGVALLRGEGPCDVGCVVRRMTTLDDSWGTVSRGRSEARDEMLLTALTDVVVP
jgi:hypothetical protein